MGWRVQGEVAGVLAAAEVQVSAPPLLRSPLPHLLARWQLPLEGNLERRLTPPLECDPLAEWGLPIQSLMGSMNAPVNAIECNVQT